MSDVLADIERAFADVPMDQLPAEWACGHPFPPDILADARQRATLSICVCAACWEALVRDYDELVGE